MSDVLRVALVFISMLIMLRLKLNIGYVLVIASALLSALYVMPLQKCADTLQATVTDSITIKLFFALTLIKMLEMLLREKKVMTAMMEASWSIIKNKRAVIISMPLLIGMLPSLSGAYFSAPMVEESTKGMRISPEEKGFINYWFRHPWEFVLPLYPGILLAAAISRIEIRSFILANTAYAVLIFITGLLFSMRNISSEKPKPRPFHASGLLSFLPVALVLISVIVFHIELHYSLALIIMLLFLFYKFGPREIFLTFRQGFTMDVVLLVFGVMFFKFTMDNSGAVANLSRYFTEAGIPMLPVLILLPFISGLLTGLTVGFVGSTFPILISLAGGAHLNQLTLAFASGFTGVLLSPVHTCLVLTREYFKADIAKIYRKTIPASGTILVAALIEYFIL